MFKGFNDFLYWGSSVNHGWWSIVVLFFPLEILLFRQILLSQDKSTKSFSWKILTFIKNESSQSFWNFVFHHWISSFQIKYYSIGCCMTHNNSHSFACTCERKNLEHFEDFILTQRIFQMDFFDCSVNQFKIQALWNLYQGNLIRTWCLINFLTVFLTWSNIMTNCKTSNEISNNVVFVSFEKFVFFT